MTKFQSCLDLSALHPLYLSAHYTSSLTIPLHHYTSPPILPLPSLYLSPHYTSPHILPIHPLYLSTHSTSPPSIHFHPLYLSTHFTSPPILPQCLTLHLVYNLVNCLMCGRWDMYILYLPYGFTIWSQLPLLHPLSLTGSQQSMMSKVIV